MKNSIQKYKIYGRKKGRKLTNDANEFLEQYKLNIPFDFINKNIILDIGSGNGENTLFLSKKYPNKLIIASDIFKDGIINLCRQLKNKNINNVKIFDQNILILFEKIKLNNLVDEIWILFPDPWPKTKHHKRRIINYNFIKMISPFLKQKGKIFIATDSNTYLIFVLNVFYNIKLFKWVNNLPSKWDYSYNNDLPETKFYKRAYKNNIKSFILIFQKI